MGLWLASAETAAKLGKAQEKIGGTLLMSHHLGWSLTFYSNVNKNHRCADLTEYQLPSCDSLMYTTARPQAFWHEKLPQIKEGKRVKIVAHGNSLLGIIRRLEDLSKEAILELHLLTGIPMVNELDRSLKPMQFLGDEEAKGKAMEAVAPQSKAKKWRITDRLLSQAHPPCPSHSSALLPCICHTDTSVGILSFTCRLESVAPNFV